MKARKYILGLVGMACIGVLIVLCIISAGNTNSFSPIGIDPIISGIHVGALTRRELENISNNPAAIQFELIEKNSSSETINAADFVKNPVAGSAFKTAIKNNLFRISNDLDPINRIAQKSNFTKSIVYDKDALDKELSVLNAFNTATVPTTGANVTYNEEISKFEPVAETIGTEVSRPSLISSMLGKLMTNKGDGTVPINLEQEKIYKQPKVTLNSELFNTLLRQLNNSLDADITYEVGWSTLNIDADTYGPWLKINENGQIYIDQSLFQEYLKNTRVGRRIYTSKEEALEKKTIMTGYLINFSTEAAEDQKAILTNASVTRTLPEFEVTIDDIAPIYTAEFNDKLSSLSKDLGSEFVYINLGRQFMWYYKNNQLLVATPITSGTRYNHDTPAGLYGVQDKATNITLKGNNDDGSKYESDVVYWVAFNGSIGIHDADNWRSDYGSNVYTYNGSHGCVNTPRSKMKIIYENITYDCPILVEK